MITSLCEGYRKFYSLTKLNKNCNLKQYSIEYVYMPSDQTSVPEYPSHHSRNHERPHSVHDERLPVRTAGTEAVRQKVN